MRLFEAILNANHRAIAGDRQAGIRPADFADALPITALTCVDPRLNPLLPEVLGISEDHFIWVRNAGNIITGPMSSTLRSLALASAIKGGREIAIIGHTDCLVRKTSVGELIDRFKQLGIPRTALPENLNEFFGLFASERQNVLRGVDFARRSPLISPRVAVHGLLVDIQTGKLDWLVNGYETFRQPEPPAATLGQLAGQAVGGLESLPEFKLGEMKFPEFKIGEGFATPHEPSVAPPAPTPPPSALPSRPNRAGQSPREIPVPPPLPRPGSQPRNPLPFRKRR